VHPSKKREYYKTSNKINLFRLSGTPEINGTWYYSTQRYMTIQFRATEGGPGWSAMAYGNATLPGKKVSFLKFLTNRLFCSYIDLLI
jgi:hypothetical protein